MDWIISNFGAIAGAIVILSVLVIVVTEFIKAPKQEQIDNVKSWLLYAVVEAEKLFGSQMGVIKLRYVYDLFVGKFPFVAKLVTFELFAAWVDEALEKMKSLIESNNKLSEYIEE